MLTASPVTLPFGHDEAAFVRNLVWRLKAQQLDGSHLLRVPFLGRSTVLQRATPARALLTI
jgi:hypothetical protein